MEGSDRSGLDHERGRIVASAARIGHLDEASSFVALGLRVAPDESERARFAALQARLPAEPVKPDAR